MRLPGCTVDDLSQADSKCMVDKRDCTMNRTTQWPRFAQEHARGFFVARSRTASTGFFSMIALAATCTTVLAGNAANTDPVCTLTPLRHIIDEALGEAPVPMDEFQYRYVAGEPVRA